MNSSLIDCNLLNEDDSNSDEYCVDQNDEKEDNEDDEINADKELDDDELTSDKTYLIYILEVLNFSNIIII
jgi:hypothetical protein